MDWGSIITQLGISALITFVGYQIAIRLIAAWAAAEKERNAALSVAEQNRTAAIAAGMKALSDTFGQGLRDVVASVQQGFKECRTDTNSVRSIVDRLEGKFDQLLDLTPVRAMTAMHEQHAPARQREAKVIVSPDLHQEEEATPPIGPPPRRTTPAKGQPYGPFTRPKTSG